MEKFKNYADQTYELYVKEYPWFYMPVTMHKLLIHSSQIIPNFELPIGFYSEEAQESRNKDNKNIRLYHTRKMNRIITISDQFNFLHATSDPIISLISMSFHRSKKKTQALPEDAAKMVKLNNSSEENEESDEEEAEDEDENDDESEFRDNNNNSIDLDRQFESILNIESNKISNLENSDFYSDF